MMMIYYNEDRFDLSAEVFIRTDHGRNHWGVGETRTPKIWTDHPSFYVPF